MADISGLRDLNSHVLDMCRNSTVFRTNSFAIAEIASLPLTPDGSRLPPG